MSVCRGVTSPQAANCFSEDPCRLVPRLGMSSQVDGALVQSLTHLGQVLHPELRF